ncbi:hypothetical protein LTR10_020201 [Elasticomyces elasticus]|uniref:Uncharacterized protein n=1 Tax=Exophiala sideris TaxID=1016849 RepID=A0ABR0JTK4_9EURO|nr:hypothetical protein LTR10_020201 [Elasticomyces elasticus]KAK5040263.1 hypothetical protein LTS07_000760 [Exophiala sideris]KAK5043311.1 hypothetical protein LTR13_001082 [Exophiala sideris]KAK5068641.1 hypothetical protein LTR69_000761 [Exophiala sideris]KAK5186239.1 hypothetical protein LTR44_001294 [Eurotiomycetes sp. CCFEE 6388]
MPVAWAKRLSTAPILPVKGYQDKDCDAAFCSAASHSIANPLRYPVWLVGQVFGLFWRTSSQGLYHEESAPDVHGLVPVSAYTPLHAASVMKDAASISRTISASALQESSNEHVVDDHTANITNSEGPQELPDLNDGDAPKEVNISEKLGGYAPVNEKALNSTASSIQTSPLGNVLRRLKSTTRSFGWTLANRYAFAPATWEQRKVASTGTGCHDFDLEDESSDYAKNACEGLGVGSALMAVWGRFGA